MRQVILTCVFVGGEEFVIYGFDTGACFGNQPAGG